MFLDHVLTYFQGHRDWDVYVPELVRFNLYQVRPHPLQQIRGVLTPGQLLFPNALQISWYQRRCSIHGYIWSLQVNRGNCLLRLYRE